MHVHVVDAPGGSTQSVQVARRLLRAGLRWRRDIAGFVHARAESGLHQELRVRPCQPVRDDPCGSLEMRYIRSLALLSRSRSHHGPTRNPTLILVLTLYPVRRSEMEKAVACPPSWLTVLLGIHSSSQVAHGDIDVGGQPHPDLAEMQKGSAELSWDSTPSPSRQLRSNPVVWMGTPDDFEGVTIDGLLEPSPSPSSDSEEEGWNRQEPKGKKGSRRQLGKKAGDCGEGKGKKSRRQLGKKSKEACSPPPPPPPACPWEVQPRECDNGGATNKETCAKHFYKKQSGEWRQCIWSPQTLTQTANCKAGGFKCEVHAEGKAGCNCPATCPKKLPFLPGAVGTNCKDQNADEDDCARCPQVPHTVMHSCYILVHYLNTRCIRISPDSSTRQH